MLRAESGNVQPVEESPHRQHRAPAQTVFLQPLLWGSGADGTKQRLKGARSDSAPLGYNNFGSSWTATRPRSGSGLAVRAPRREDIVVPSIGSVARAVAAASQPILPPMGSLAVTTPGVRMCLVCGVVAVLSALQRHLTSFGFFAHFP